MTAAPHDTDADRLAWLRLTRSRNVGPATFARLMARYASAAKALEALPDLAARGGEARYQICSERQAAEEMERAARSGARMLRLGEPAYPAELAAIDDPPPFLWAFGDVSLDARDAVAVIGARNASSLGLRIARTLAADIGAAGYVIASGFARGVDAAAHEASVETGTVAVMAGGVDHIYPKENQALYARLREQGLILSEAPMGLQPQGRHFPRRNRIVSGLSKGVVLVEAASRSGTLITARFALEQGREAMAVPGSPLDPRAAGCNDLIRQGGALIRSADDVIEALAAPRTISLHESVEPFDRREEAREAADPPTDLAARAVDMLGPSPVEADGLARDLGVDPAHLSAALLEMELAGLIERRSGGLIARVS